MESGHEHSFSMSSAISNWNEVRLIRLLSLRRRRRHRPVVNVIIIVVCHLHDGAKGFSLVFGTHALFNVSEINSKLIFDAKLWLNSRIRSLSYFNRDMYCVVVGVGVGAAVAAGNVCGSGCLRSVLCCALKFPYVCVCIMLYFTLVAFRPEFDKRICLPHLQLNFMQIFWINFCTLNDSQYITQLL